MGQVNYAEIAITWIIRLVILYFVLSLLEGIVDWKYWVIIAIGLLLIFLIVDKALEYRKDKPTQISKVGEYILLTWMIFTAGLAI
jgi:hypothetical protein